jgi:hypothetical protein
MVDLLLDLDGYVPQNLVDAVAVERSVGGSLPVPDNRATEL